MRQTTILGPVAEHGARHAEFGASVIQCLRFHGSECVEVAVLAGDPATGANIRPVKLPAGFTAPDHGHTGDHHGVNLAGTWKHTLP